MLCTFLNSFQIWFIAPVTRVSFFLINYFQLTALFSLFQQIVLILFWFCNHLVHVPSYWNNMLVMICIHISSKQLILLIEPFNVHYYHNFR